MSLETFLTQCELLFNIFSQEGEPMEEDYKIRFIFKVIDHEGLSKSVEDLKSQRTSGVKMSYTTCCNHLTTAVTELEDFQ